MSDTENHQGLEELLIYLKQNRSFDFTGYKRSSLMRRIQRRMMAVGAETFDDYQDYLEVHPREFEILFNTILINFTGFFRDADAWKHVEEQIIPNILKTVSDNEPIRVWSAGCASGEEAYTLAILFAEAMGMDDYRARLKIYATDVDEHALAQARQAVYSENAVQGVPVEWRERYFEPLDDRYTFRKELRRILVFGRHDLMRDAPISRLDLLVCRNTLIYFNRLSQKRILANFHFAIKDTGFLFLGRAEMLLAQDNLFEAENINHRIFTRIADMRLRDKLLLANQDADASPPIPRATSRLWEMAFQASPAAQVIVDAHGFVALANKRAQELFGLLPSDIGHPFRDLELSYRPVELRSVIERAQAAKAVVRLADVERVLLSGHVQYFDIEVAPLALKEGMKSGTHLSFVDVSSRQLLHIALDRAKQDVQTSNEELQATNEELETSNEELQSTVEELQTTNEELQSTNEEMETVNEELHSTNQELQTVNDELHRQTLEADRAKHFLESILASVEVGVIVIDQDYRILLWNDRSEDLWGLRSDEVRGRPLLKLDTGLPVDELVKPLQRRWSDPNGSQHEILLAAINRRGRPVHLRITMTLRDTGDPHSQSVVLVMNEEAQP